MSVMNTSCLYSTVKNTSGTAKTFGFLPPHGRKLAANEEFTTFGSIQTAILGIERTTSRRNITAFENAVARGDLVIVSTPAPIFEAEGVSKMIKLTDGGALIADDPCWTSVA